MQQDCCQPAAYALACSNWQVIHHLFRPRGCRCSAQHFGCLLISAELARHSRPTVLLHALMQTIKRPHDVGAGDCAAGGGDCGALQRSGAGGALLPSVLRFDTMPLLSAVCLLTHVLQPCTFDADSATCRTMHVLQHLCSMPRAWHRRSAWSPAACARWCRNQRLDSVWTYRTAGQRYFY